MWMSCNEVIWGMNDYFSSNSVILNSVTKFTKYLANNSSSIFLCVSFVYRVSFSPVGFSLTLLCVIIVTVFVTEQKQK